MPNPPTAGDLFFEGYCTANGYITQRDVDWRELYGVDTEKDPDYLIERGGDQAIVEVKHFETTRTTQRLLDAPGQAVWSGGRELYGTLQSSIRKAGEQLAPSAAVGIPLVIVVTNPLGADVDFEPDDVVSACSGRSSFGSPSRSPTGRSPSSAESTAPFSTERHLATGSTASPMSLPSWSSTASPGSSALMSMTWRAHLRSAAPVSPTRCSTAWARADTASRRRTASSF